MAPADSTSPKSYLAIGQIVGPHGIKGEVKVEVMTDFPERFKQGAKAYLASTADGADARAVTMVASRKHHDRMLVRLNITPDRSAAETLRGYYLLIPEDEAMPLGEHENYAHDVIGLRVETAEGEFVGAVAEIVFTAANDVYVLRGPQGEVLVPATREVVLSVDLAARKMIVALPEGLREPAEPDEDEASPPSPLS
jgi:16S rRNA processing protein RimM